MTINEYRCCFFVGPYEIDFPAEVVLKGHTVGCSPTPPEMDCDWQEDWYYACHNVM